MTIDRETGVVDTFDPGLRISDRTGAPKVDDYTQFYRVEFRPVARTVYLIVHDAQRAEDITQEAFLQLLRHWKKVSRYERPGAWVRRVAIRMATKQVRREQLRRTLERDVQSPPSVRTVDFDLIRAGCRSCLPSSAPRSSCSTSRTDR